MSAFTTWLEGLGHRRTLPSSPARPQIREYAKILAALRRDLPDVDQRLRSVDLDAAWLTSQLQLQERQYRQKLRECYVAIACLVVIILALVIP